MFVFIVSVLPFCAAASGLLLVVFESQLYSGPISPRYPWIGQCIYKAKRSVDLSRLFDSAIKNQKLEVAYVDSDKFVFSLRPEEGDGGSLIRGVASRDDAGVKFSFKYPIGFTILFLGGIVFAAVCCIYAEQRNSWLSLFVFYPMVAGMWAIIYFSARGESKQALQSILEPLLSESPPNQTQNVG